MDVRTRGLDIAINAKRQVAHAAARAEAKAIIEHWNEQLVTSRDMLWSPTIRASAPAGQSICGRSIAIPGVGRRRILWNTVHSDCEIDDE